MLNAAYLVRILGEVAVAYFKLVTIWGKPREISVKTALNREAPAETCTEREA
jgi:hypothetical protein